MTPARCQRLRRLLWLYFWLLIFEGALRRWFLPGLANPLLLVRDPVALLALWWGWPLLKQSRWSAWLNPLLVIGLIAFVLAITLGHGDPFVAAYGARIMVLQLPLIFLFPVVFNRDDVIRFAWVMLTLSIPMAILIALQSNLPETHLLNVGPGGVGTAVFDGAGGRFRPPGTFTFINGVSLFFTLAAASLFVVLYGTESNQRSRLFSVMAGIALVVALPVSISRSLLAGYLMVLAATFAALTLSRTRIVPLLSGVVAIAVAVGLATAVPAFQDTSDAFVTRWENAALAESGDNQQLGGSLGVFNSRILAGFTEPLATLEDVPLAGYGIGIGTNLGAQQLTGDLSFLVGEGALESSLNELGLPLGLAFLFWRLLFAFWLLWMAIRQAVRGNRMPLILMGAAFLSVLGGQISQPTGLGFLVISSGLSLAACNSATPPVTRLGPVF